MSRILHFKTPLEHHQLVAKSHWRAALMLNSLLKTKALPELEQGAVRLQVVKGH